MPIQFVKKPPIGKTGSGRLKVTLAGTHSLDDKQCMAIQIFHRLQLDGFPNAGTIDFYIPLLDSDIHPLTHFANGTLISDFDMRIDSPYDCAADEYDRRQPALAPRPF
jgi:hypothetical protein